MSGAGVHVTGGTGFIGTHLCERLAELGHDLRSGGRGPVELGDAGVLVHLAHPMAAALSDGLFRAAAEGDVRRVVLMSSVKAMAEATPPGVALTEDDEPRPRTEYGRAKLAVEDQARAWADRGGFELVVLRPPVVHGAGARGALAKLADAVTRGIPLPLGGICNARSVVGVDNLVDAVVRCLSDERAAGRTFLVADTPPVSTPELVRLLAAAAGRSARLLPAPQLLLRAAARALGRPAAASARRLLSDLIVDDRAIRRTLDWTPPLDLEEGLRRMMSQWR